MNLDHVNPVGGTVQLTLGRRAVHRGPRRQIDHAADDLRPPRCPATPSARVMPATQCCPKTAIWHRDSTGHQIWSTRCAGCDLRPLGYDGWQGGPARRTHLAGGRRKGETRYAAFEHGAIYWSPAGGAEPLGGGDLRAWAPLGYERGALGPPTSAGSRNPSGSCRTPARHPELRPADPQRPTGDRRGDAGDAAAPVDGPPVQLERFSRVIALTASGPGAEPPPFQHAGQPVVGVGRGHLVGRGDRLRVGVAHRHAEAGHRSIGTSLGMSPKATTSSAVISSGPCDLLDTGGLAGADRVDLDLGRCWSSR